MSFDITDRACDVYSENDVPGAFYVEPLEQVVDRLVLKKSRMSILKDFRRENVRLNLVLS